ncbi:hypothetical protein RFI_05264 [Reticulomyxa filosa]|uniref:Uncharacterized protein n=1 Tax=Reticulomyxa filosa TaxID=46433 RepID=X6P152_RETFI|nr:hypothetical protein RFI_05264 [Reticulomyxa filosa]|eukprot:ETO31858.1 hypothetical protein RFI_05264 [Reticulomyxa filosa]
MRSSRLVYVFCNLLLVNQAKIRNFEQTPELNVKNGNSLHEKIELYFNAVPQPNCIGHKTLFFGMTLRLFEQLHDENSSILYYYKKKKPSIDTFRKYRSYLGHASVNTNVHKKQQRKYSVSLSFVSDINHVISGECLEFNAKIWTEDALLVLICIVQAAPKTINRQTEAFRRILASITPFDNCFKDQYLHLQSVKIGLLIDNGFLAEFGTLSPFFFTVVLFYKKT